MTKINRRDALKKGVIGIIGTGIAGAGITKTKTVKATGTIGITLKPHTLPMSQVTIPPKSGYIHDCYIDDTTSSYLLSFYVQKMIGLPNCTLQPIDIDIYLCTSTITTCPNDNSKTLQKSHTWPIIDQCYSKDPTLSYSNVFRLPQETSLQNKNQLIIWNDSPYNYIILKNLNIGKIEIYTNSKVIEDIHSWKRKPLKFNNYN